MLVSLGKRAPAETLVELLLGCHERIRKFTQLAIQISDCPPSEGHFVVQASQDVERYFTVALPLHVADEERSLLPRLQGLRAELDAQLLAMAAEHRDHEPLLAELQEALRAVRDAPMEVTHRPRLATCSKGLLAAWESHLAREETVIFPAIGELLSPDVQRLIVDELRARRRSP